MGKILVFQNITDAYSQISILVMDSNSKKLVDKYRLFVTLFDRKTTPSSFHFSLLLSPKDHKNNHSIAFHVTNTIDLDHRHQGGSSDRAPWRYHKYTVNPRTSSTLVAKILVAKLPSSETEDLPYWEKIIHTILASIAVPNSDNLNCRTWALTALQQLHDQGGEHFTNIPWFLPAGTGKLEEEMIKTANEGRAKLLKYGFKNFSPAELDIRTRKDCAK